MNGSPPREAPRHGITVEVDARRCCSAGHCARLVPEVFEQDESDGTSVVVQPNPAPALAPRLHELAAVCPTSAITITARG